MTEEIERKSPSGGGDAATVALAKLRALGAHVAGLLPPGPGRYFNPDGVLDCFERFAAVRDELRRLNPTAFGDVPVRPTPAPSGSTDFGGRGYIERGHLEQLRRDIQYMLSVAQEIDHLRAREEGGPMDLVANAGQALDLLNGLRTDLLAILKKAAPSGPNEPSFERLKRWKERAVRLIAASVSLDEARRLQERTLTSFDLDHPITNLRNEVALYDGFLEALCEELETHPAAVLSAPVGGAELDSQDRLGGRGSTVPRTRKVFIIHGHDDANTLRLQRLLKEKFKLVPIVLSLKPGKGRTLIEKFEQEAAECAFAFALLTDDDTVKMPSGEYTQARPNVVFELGWFYGRIARQNVLMLVRQGTQLHSDLSGISLEWFRDSVEEKVLEIERELLAAKLVADRDGSDASPA